MSGRILASFIIILIISADAMSKFWVQQHIPLMYAHSQEYPYGGIGVFRNFMGIEFSIIHATNRGAAWSLFSQYQGALMVIRGLFVIGLVVYLYFYNRRKAWVIPLSMIVAGALANILDYFLYGHVIDMLHFVLWGYDYPVFNIADSAITLGIMWMILLLMTESKTKAAN